MPTAIDTSILIAAEEGGNFFAFIAAIPGEFYIPAAAAAEFLVGTLRPSKNTCGNAPGGCMKPRSSRWWNRLKKPMLPLPPRPLRGEMTCWRMMGILTGWQIG
jgi:predicted nucleic acid-binding protein